MQASFSFILTIISLGLEWKSKTPYQCPNMITNGTYFNAHSYHQNIPLSRGAGSFLFISRVFFVDFTF